MFDKVLIANRSEIARRIARSCKKLGIGVVAVHSEADRDAPFVKEADEAVEIGPAAPKESYLRVDRIMDAADKTGAQAIHPGYGFLSESPDLVGACEETGVTFIGPGLPAIKKMGSKVAAREVMKAAGVPIVPGSPGPVETEDDAAAEAERIGYPVMLKTSHGGGGIGMSVCKKEKKLREAFADARKKGEMFFGSGELLLEKLIEAPHHVEVQILADGFGNTLHLYDRECSVQRRNQKIVEEAPSPFISPETRAAICNAAVRAAEAVGYVNAGTVEMIVDGDQNFYFLEMNTRLQVEHPITELICGLDIVAWQLKIAAGDRLTLRQEDIKPDGHAIEARLCAEDPDKRFFPAPGTLETVVWPQGEGIRVDAGVEAGSAITPYYDSMFAKLCAHGSTREEAIKRLRAALEATQLVGTKTNLELHKRIMDDEVFQGGTYTTAYLKDVLGLKS